MYEKEKKENSENKVVKLPIRNIRMMTDEEWNRLAYKNAMERRAVTA